jgi:two-component sensor histidine kinase
VQEALARPTTSEARRHVQILLADQTPEVRYVAALLVTELMGNAIRHAKGADTVKLTRRGAMFSAEVFDASPVLPEVQGIDPLSASGLGLLVVSSLAKSWSAEPHGSGKVVRFELEITPAEFEPGQPHEVR